MANLQYFHNEDPHFHIFHEEIFFMYEEDSLFLRCIMTDNIYLPTCETKPFYERIDFIIHVFGESHHNDMPNRIRSHSYIPTMHAAQALAVEEPFLRSLREMCVLPEVYYLLGTLLRNFLPSITKR